MKITYLLMITALFLGGCGDVAITTTSGADSAPAEVITVEPVIVE